MKKCDCGDEIVDKKKNKCSVCEYLENLDRIDELRSKR